MLEVKPVKKQEIPRKIRIRSLLYHYFWPVFGFVIMIPLSIIIWCYFDTFITITALIILAWVYYDFFSPNAMFVRKFINAKPEEKKAMDEFSASYVYINTGNYSLLSGRDIFEKIVNFSRAEFERFLKFILHPVILIPYSVFAFFHFDKFSKFGEGAPFLYFSAVLLLWYTNETFMLRRNQELERLARFKIKKKNK